MVREVPFKDEPLHHVIIEAIKGGTPVPKTDPPPDTPRDFVRLMKDCYSFAPGMRPVFSGIITKIDDLIKCEKRRMNRGCENRKGYLLLPQVGDVALSPQRSRKAGDCQEQKVDLYKREYYFGKMSREEAEIALTQPETTDKTFLVRESTTVNNALVLCTVSSDCAKNYLILRNDKGGYTFPTNGDGHGVPEHSHLTFCSINEYIDDLQRRGCITVPCKRDHWECGDRLSTYREELITTGRRSVVFEGEWTPDDRRRKATIKAAVRELNTSVRNVQNIEELIACAKLLKSLNHPQIVKLLGVRTTGKCLCIATEFMERSNLSGYLLTEGSGLRMPHLLSIAKEITRGMRYLSEDKMIVHRKLKASNVLIGHNPLADVRITGFSSARSIPSGSKSVKGDEDEELPVKWLAPESLRELTFSVKSDVWSFGVIVYELVTHGGKPYPQLKNEQVKSFVCGTRRMLRPEGCPEDVYALMSNCWACYGKVRPSFSFLQDHLDRLVVQNMTNL